VQFRNRVAHLVESCDCRLHNQEPFSSLFHLVLPAVDGCELWDDIYASGEAPFEQNSRDLVGLFFGARGGEDDSFVGYRESAVSLGETPTEERVAF
jgi:hypothetical protein